MHDQTEVRIPESDRALLAECRVETFGSGGAGGQHQNRTESGVRLVHIPTGARVTVRESRSQWRNRRLAIRRLRKRLRELQERAAPRIATRVPAGEKEKRRAAKKHRSETKRSRRRPSTDD